MKVASEDPRPYGEPTRYLTATDVAAAADALLRKGERPTVERVRTYLGRGSPNTINPLLDAWWKTLGARLDAGPAALHRLPEPLLHVVESLWLQLLEEARKRAAMELKRSSDRIEDRAQDFEVRSHVLSLREGELDARLKDRERALAAADAQLRELLTVLKKDQATREAQSTRIVALESELEASRQRMTTVLAKAVVTHARRKVAAAPARRTSARKKSASRKVVPRARTAKRRPAPKRKSKVRR